MSLSHSFVGTDIDKAKVEADAHRRAHDYRVSERAGTLIHYHKHGTDCPWTGRDVPGPNTFNDPSLIKKFGQHRLVIPPLKDETQQINEEPGKQL